MSKTPIETLREVYPLLDNGHKETFATAVKELQAQLSDLQSSLARQLPEAPASATAKVVDPQTQIEWLVTVRDPAAARLLIRELPAMNAALTEAGLIAFDAYVDQRRSERENGGGNPPRGDTQGYKPQAPQRPAVPYPATSADVKRGTGNLLELTIDSGGKASFKIDTLQYPLKDSRGAAAIAALFDPALGWEEAHFAKPAIYTVADFGALKLDWVKPGKYYDAVRIYAA